MLRVIREMQIKTTMRYYLTPVRMPIIHKKQIQHVFTQMGKKKLLLVGMQHGNCSVQFSCSVLSDSSRPQFKSINSLVLSFLYIKHSHPYMTTGKTIALTRWTFVGKVMSLLFNMLSRLVIAFLPRSKHLLISWLQSPSAVICHEVMGSDVMILVFWMLNFKPAFLLSSFTFIKRLFSSSLLSAIRVVSSACLRLLIFLPAILIPACASSSPAFLMMYSAYVK